jgi:pyruvate kinase
VPIFAFSTNEKSRRRMAMFRDVFPVKQVMDSDDADKVVSEALKTLMAHGAVKEDDRVLITMGDQMCRSGGTNTLRFVKLDAAERAHYGI